MPTTAKSFVAKGTANGCTTASSSANTAWYGVDVAYAYDLAGRPVSALYPNPSGAPGVVWTYEAGAASADRPSSCCRAR